MPATIAESGPCKVTLSVTVPAEDVKSKIDHSYVELQRTANVKGFRPGKCPIKRLKRLYGSQVSMNVRDDLLSDSLQNAIKEHSLEPIGNPRIENMTFQDEQEFSFQAVCFVKPKFDVKDYLGVEVDVERPKVTDEAVEDILNQVRRSKGSGQTKPEGAKVDSDDDLVMADVHIHFNGEVISHDHGFGPIFEGTKGVRGIPVEDLFKKLKGKKVGDEVKIKATVPETYLATPEARGKEVEIHIKITELNIWTMPAMEDLLKEMDYATEDELRADIRKGQEARAEQESHAAAESAILTKVVAANAGSLDLPEDLIQEEAQQIVARRQLEMQQQGKSEEEIAAALEELQYNSKNSLMESFKTYFILDRIAQKEKIFVTENDVNQAVASIAANYGHPAEAVREHMEANGQMSQLRNQLRESKIRKFLREKGKVTEVDALPAADDKEPKAKAKSKAKKSKS